VLTGDNYWVLRVQTRNKCPYQVYNDSARRGDISQICQTAFWTPPFWAGRWADSRFSLRAYRRLATL